MLIICKLDSCLVFARNILLFVSAVMHANTRHVNLTEVMLVMTIVVVHV